ncbi:MAG: malto-oligosyltrehalose synthase [Marmoricola sp.]
MRVPASTYRLQVTADLDLHRVAELVPYLHDLGVDWVYLSPLLAAEPGSDHGYDVVAHDHIDPARGGSDGLAAVSRAARDHGMGVIVDIVPNHVGVATPHEDAWWWDLLQHGRDSVHAHAFDVDWAAGDGRIRIPVVGEDDIPDGPEGPIDNLRLDGQELVYHDHRFPIAPGTATDGDDANAVHDRQHYALVSWHAADDQLNYRRFFAVNELAAVRVEDRDVFEETHVEVRRWFDEGLVDGLRVDHPDGLRHPGTYLRDLADLTGGAYVLVEKILSLSEDPDRLDAGEVAERMPPDWETAGTTGYDVLSLIDRVLTDPAGEAPLTALEERVRGTDTDWHRLVHDSKRAVADGILNSEVRRIVRDLVRGGLTPADGRTVVDPSAAPEPAPLVDAVAELLACFPVYRSYLPFGGEHLDAAFAAARARRPDLDAALDRLVEPLHDPVGPGALRFQQTSGMVMAKGVEDSAFYRWARLTSLDEVGGEPALFSLRPARFHAAMAVRQTSYPHAMTALSTHDTKRGEDVRARITVLSERPELWASALDRLLAAAPLPDGGFANLLWQAVVGAWPAGPGGSPPPDLRARLHAYAEKAMREAGDRTTWTEPDEAYEAAVHAAVDAAFDRQEVGDVVTEVVEDLAGPGWSNALAAKLLSLTVPGVPDVYQGSELWEQSLVDPDNRRPVDFAARGQALRSLPADGAAPLGTGPDDPALAKLQLTSAALRLRRDRPDVFTTYRALHAHGEAADHVLAFDRGGAVAVVTRLPAGLAARGGWGGTTLALPGRFRDAITGREAEGEVHVEELLRDHPAVLLVEDR